jgi:REP element-mobilizing transposase RayT
MGYARKSLVSLQDTPYYHVIARCVRRAWLWGFDEYAGKDYSHRKAWVLERLAQLSSVFAVDVCAYAVLSNHYHLVVYVDQSRARGWSAEQVIERWNRVFDLPTLVKCWQGGEATEAEKHEAEKIIKVWRSRLCDVSWYMRCLNEHLARRANAEDDCSGRFWQGRFKSQALLDEAGLLTAMAYVDLNPIRAGIAGTPEDSEFTSIQARIRAAGMPLQCARGEVNSQATQIEKPAVALLSFRDRAAAEPYIPFSLRDYLELVDWTARAIRDGKRGHIDAAQPPILMRLNIDRIAWHTMMQPHGNRFGRALGPLDHLRLHARTLGQSWIRGLKQAEQMYRSA